MNSQDNLVTRIETHRSDLRRSERKVADFVLEMPQPITRMTLAALAQEADVSEPTIIRFCRALGCEGFPDFKLRLAQSLASGAPYVHREVGAGDGLPEIADKIFNASIANLAAIHDQLDMPVLERATEVLAKARRIDCFGVGLASVAAIDAHQKFMRLGVPASVCADVHLQTMSAATLKKGDAALAFSYTGQIRDIVRCAEVGREQGATIIGVTREGSRLAEVCTLTICVDPVEDTFVYAPMTTRLAHLAVVDVLATAVALRRGPGMPEQFRRIKNTLRDQWILDGGAAGETVNPGEP